MHFYQFHIGDYKSHTHHLSPIEDLAFRRLLDHYYLHEQPIKQRDIARLIGLRDYEQDVLTVLNEFFISTEDGYIHTRADEEIAKYRKLSEDGKRGAAKRWLKGGDSPPIATPIATMNHEPLPITINQSNKQRGSRLPKDWVPDVELVDWSKKERPDLDLKKVLNEFRDYWVSVPGAKGVKLDWDATWRNWVRNQKAERQTFAQQAADIAKTTVPSRQTIDPVLVRLEEERKKAVPMPAHIRDQINSALRKV